MGWSVLRVSMLMATPCLCLIPLTAASTTNVSASSPCSCLARPASGGTPASMSATGLRLWTVTPPPRLLRPLRLRRRPQLRLRRRPQLRLRRLVPRGESFQGKCYKYFKSWKSWSEARASCQAAGGDLASAGDEATNDFLSGLTSFRAWIGGRRVATASREWIWTDGTTWGFENWSWGNPNNFIAQNSLVINYGRRGQWNDDMGYKKW